MKKENKKNIAREILIFLSIIPIGLITLLIVFLLDQIQQSKINNLQEEVEREKAMLERLNNEKLDLKYYRFFPVYNSIDLRIDIDDYDAFFKAMLEKSQRKRLFSMLKAEGYLDEYDSFFDFELKHQPGELAYAENRKEAREIEAQIKKAEKDVVLLEQKRDSIKVYNYKKSLYLIGAVFFILVYPIRGLIAVTIWSIRTLKS